MTLKELIDEGKGLLIKVISVNRNDRTVIAGELPVNIKSLHVKGRYLLKNVDKITFEEYKNLFSGNNDKNMSWDKWNAFLRIELEKCVGIFKAIETIGIDNIKDRNFKKIFISHGKFTPAFTKLETFIRALNLLPTYDINEPSEGKNINKHVSDLIEKSDFFIILATKETSNEKGIYLPNHNVSIEFDRLIQLGKNNLVVLLEEDCKMPTMHQDIVYGNFKTDNMDDAFIKLASEFVHNDIL